jgi:protein-arginine kinase activator protein McsA
MLDEDEAEDDPITESLEEETVESSNSLESLTDQELNQQMQAAVENEDYELASKIRDELTKRASN